MRWVLFVIIIFISTYAFAGNIPSPPRLKDEPAAEQLYLQRLYNNWNNLEETTTNPNGNRLGDIGNEILYKATYLRYYYAVNIDGAYHWWAVELKDIL